MTQTHLMPEPHERQEDMSWEQAVSQVDWAVHEWLDYMAEYSSDYVSDDSDRLIRAWARILRG
jgi:hypothetical protein